MFYQLARLLEFLKKVNRFSKHPEIPSHLLCMSLLLQHLRLETFLHKMAMRKFLSHFRTIEFSQSHSVVP